MSIDDLDAVVDLADAVHLSFPEDSAVFAEQTAQALVLNRRVIIFDPPPTSRRAGHIDGTPL